MEWFPVAVIASLAGLIGAAFRLGRSLPRRSARQSLLSPVTQQHLHLFQGGRLSEAAVETAKVQLRSLLEAGRVADAEASLRPGLQYAVHVQALAELQSPHAGTILREQLRRRLSDDPIEQSWYWIDLAHGLRNLGRTDCIPNLLRCPATEVDSPLSQYYAAETVCCPGFIDVLRRPLSPLGQSALRMLHQVLRGLRHGVPPQSIVDGRLGAAVSRVWRHRPDRAHPLVVRILVEALRLLQRADHVEHALAGHVNGGEALQKQLGELRMLSDVFADYLGDAIAQLRADLASCDDDRRPDIFAALHELQGDAGAVIVQRLRTWPRTQRPAAVRLLRHSRNQVVAPALMDWTRQWLQPERRSWRLPRDIPPSRPSVPSALPYTDILFALRAHPSLEAEAFLRAAACDWDPTIRAAALGSLGWWDPIERPVVHELLQYARSDGNAEVRLAAEAALARLGERKALQTFRQLLIGETETPVSEAIRRVAVEGLTWLWPELDTLADSDDMETAQHAREALEQMREDFGRLPWRK